MKTEVFPGAVGGGIAAVPSKAFAHRILICAAFSDRPTAVKGLYPSDDVNATKSCLAALGVGFEERLEDCLVVPPDKLSADAVLDCSESGSTLRFLLPVTAALGVKAAFTGKGKLPDRPLAGLAGALRRSGAEISSDALPLSVLRGITGRMLTVDGSVSSQYTTGMLLAMAASGGERELRVTGKRVSGSYIDITAEVLRAFGVTLTHTEQGFVTRCERLISPKSIEVEGDWSNAAFWLVAGATGKRVLSVSNLRYPSAQGDSAIADLLVEMNAKIEIRDGVVTAYPSRLKGIETDFSDCPDLAPVMSVAAAHAEGKSVFTGVSRLRYKECDRLNAIVKMLSACGISVAAEDDRLIIEGGSPERGLCECFGDHRMIMSAAVMGLSCGCVIDDAAGVAKSYPNFFRDFESLGGKYAVAL